VDRIFKGDKHIVIFSLLSQVRQKKGLKDKAKEHYQKFLELWKDADHGIAEVEDARKSWLG